MSGGSWEYTYRKVLAMSEDLAEGLERGYCSDDESEQPQHPLRIALSLHMAHLAAVLKEIEWADSGDSGEQDWIDAVEAFLNCLPLDCPDPDPAFF